jgi:hypothetical protein
MCDVLLPPGVNPTAFDVNIDLSSGVMVLIVCWQERGMPVPHPNIHGPSAYIPVEEVRAIAHPFVIRYFSSAAAGSFCFQARILQETNKSELHAWSHARLK